MTVELPLAEESQHHERADAARNRRRILAAARELVSELGIEQVGMDEVARRARVGTGTLYRRFGDRAGLALALLDQRERCFQDELLRGAPPLGPGAPARERLLAFGAAYLALLDEHRDLMAAAAPAGLAVGGPSDFYRTHLLVLLQRAGLTGDLEYVVASLMSAINPALHRHLRDVRGWSLERLQAGFASLLDAWLAPMAARVPDEESADPLRPPDAAA